LEAVFPQKIAKALLKQAHLLIKSKRIFNFELLPHKVGKMLGHYYLAKILAKQIPTKNVNENF